MLTVETTTQARPRSNLDEVQFFAETARKKHRKPRSKGGGKPFPRFLNRARRPQNMEGPLGFPLQKLRFTNLLVGSNKTVTFGGNKGIGGTPVRAQGRETHSGGAQPVLPVHL